MALLHFVVLGALLFGVKQWTADGRALGLGVEPIVISAAQVERLRAEWILETHREPTRAELEAAIRHEADEEALLREALRLGLDRTDRIVRSRLVQNMRFARGGSIGSDAIDPIASDPIEGEIDSDPIFREALALDMPRRDVVARRRLIQAMEERLAVPERITDAQLREYVAAHADRYAPRRRISFDQVFIPNDPDGGALLPGSRVAQQSEADLARTFGAGFARAALQAAPGEWVGPLRSAYGLHVIRVASVTEGPADAAPLRRQAWYALLEERERAAVQAALADLRRAYPVRVGS